MTNTGDDCYFYYYSTCTKGDGCPFRHCEAAMGSETVCNLWQDDRCFRKVCKFRHMNIKKNRKEIACYWENQPGGCQKPHCAFHHEKPRIIDGLYVPPDKGTAVRKEKEEETLQEDHVPSAPAPVSNPTNPQLRGVLKAETQDSVPSPTHPPVVINPVDDEDDEDDQFSEEGDEASGISPRKPVSSNKDDSLNFGIKTLEEIRLRKALKANLKRAGHPGLQGADSFTLIAQHSNGTGTEKENIRSPTRPCVLTTKNELLTLENPGKRKPSDIFRKRTIKEDMPVEGELRLKGNLVKRLGGFIDSPENAIDVPPQKALRSVYERLGVPSDLAAPKSPKSEPKPSGEIRIKTLEEIRQEKAAKSQIQHKGVRVVTEEPTKASNPTKKGNKPVSLKTFSELLHEKKLQQDEKGVSQEGCCSSEKRPGPASVGAVSVATPSGEVRVKTLEEIRKEKATRLNAHTQEASDGGPKRRILRINKNRSATNNSSQKKLQESEKVDHIAESVTTNGKSDSSSQAVMVKSFEEIMREKRLRKQQEEQSSSASLPVQAVQKPDPSLPEDKPPSVKLPRMTPPTTTSILITESSNQPKPSVRQRLGLKTSPVPVIVPQRKSTELETEENSPTTSPKQSKPLSSVTVQVAEVAASPGLHSQEPQPEKTLSAPKTMEMKVRPKVNVRPSVMKPAAQVNPGQKRKAAGTHGSAVAAVKPLNAVPASETQHPYKRIELSVPNCSSEVGSHIDQMSALHKDDVALPDKTATSVTEPSVVPQSPVIKTPTQMRTRRASVVSSRGHFSAGHSSTVDDFEDLLDEFTDDRLENEMELDPGKGEDDLLLELSEMIDS
ncbi:zinc finger CCCH domain-containing protein 11A isoform X2 [Electrophorus electricus]|uniref:C3H1-type domain-containing protein n=1 Tax=Electrophorus electricus TaxID=8005 RepID=A0A4W4G4W7_ELEEL|nr:zinc finger CCCH domain-containing protein 11A isoform X2 [Electrophorus electricus]